jgi:cell division protein FtsB
VQSRPARSRLSERPKGVKARVTAAIGMEESFGRRRARRTALYIRAMMWITGLVCTALLFATLAQAWSNSNLMQQVQIEQQALHQVQQEHDRLGQAAQQAQDPAAIESEARQELGYIRPGEQPLIVMNADNKGQAHIKTEQKKTQQPGYWQQWWQIFFGN